MMRRSDYLASAFIFAFAGAACLLNFPETALFAVLSWLAAFASRRS